MGVICTADIDADCSVGILDLLALMANWGPCTNPGSEAPPRTVQDCLDRYLNNPEKLEACLLSVQLQTQ